MTVAIVCGSGGYRTVFIHGVLSALEQAGLQADAYAGTSASVLAAAGAAVGMSNAIGVDYWKRALTVKTTGEHGMSSVMLTCIAEQAPAIKEKLFLPESPRFYIPVSYVKNPEAAAQTQSNQARKLGRQLLLQAARRQPSDWVRENLEHQLFSTSPDSAHRLTPENFDEVAYASTRMMHAWDIPATINGKPYVDASYLCAIPAVELLEQGYDEIIAIAADPPGALYRDIFGTRTVEHPRIRIIMPDVDPGPQGADFTDATETGLLKVYQQGEAVGRQFLETWPSSESI